VDAGAELTTARNAGGSASKTELNSFFFLSFFFFFGGMGIHYISATIATSRV